MARIGGTVDNASRGYSCVGLLILATTMSVASFIAIPVYSYVRLKEQTADIIADFAFFRMKVVEYYREHRQWPLDAEPGREPTELAPHLNGKIIWQQSHYVYEWDNWRLEDEGPQASSPPSVVGFNVRTKDGRLIQMIEKMWGCPLPRIAGDDGVIFLIQSPSSSS